MEPDVLRQDVYEAFPFVTLSDTTFDHDMSGSYLPITYGSAGADRFGLHSTSSNTHRVNLPFRPGLYLVQGTVQFPANATGQRGVKIVNQNGTALAFSRYDAAASGVTQMSTATMVVAAAAAAWVALEVYQNSGGTLSNLLSAFSMRYMGPSG